MLGIIFIDLTPVKSNEIANPLVSLQHKVLFCFKNYLHHSPYNSAYTSLQICTILLARYKHGSCTEQKQNIPDLIFHLNLKEYTNTNKVMQS